MSLILSYKHIINNTTNELSRKSSKQKLGVIVRISNLFICFENSRFSFFFRIVTQFKWASCFGGKSFQLLDTLHESVLLLLRSNSFDDRIHNPVNHMLLLKSLAHILLFNMVVLKEKETKMHYSDWMSSPNFDKEIEMKKFLVIQLFQRKFLNKLKFFLISLDQTSWVLKGKLFRWYVDG